MWKIMFVIATQAHSRDLPLLPWKASGTLERVPKFYGDSEAGAKRFFYRLFSRKVPLPQQEILNSPLFTPSENSKLVYFQKQRKTNSRPDYTPSSNIYLLPFWLVLIRYAKWTYLSTFDFLISNKFCRTQCYPFNLRVLD